ncbi:unnamed protein product [Amoebophrya sp. A120]|nr:unnamed protein product [Amoebophrya sp. A120]|eukprot:GSA120T00007700001.1
MAALFKQCFSAQDFTQVLLIGLGGVGKSTLMQRLKVPQWKLERMASTLADLRQYKVWDGAGEAEEDQKTADAAKWGRPIEYTSFTGSAKRAALQEPGYNYEVFNDFGLWDIPSIVSDMLPNLWALFYRAVKYHAVFYVISSSDADRLELCKKHIFSLLYEEELREAPLVILINSRKENPYDVSRDAFYYELELYKLPPNRVQKFAFDFSAIKGPRDPNITQVLDFVRNKDKYPSVNTLVADLEKK